MKALFSRYSFPWHGLTAQLFVVVILPLTLLLLAFAFGSTVLHQREMRNLVGERDELAVRTATSALSTQFQHRLTEIQGLASRPTSITPEALEELLAGSDYLAPAFDEGLAFFSQGGDLLASTGDQPLWNSLETSASTPLLDLIEPGILPAVSRVLSHPVSGDPVILFAASSESRNLLVVGAVNPALLAERTLADAFPPGSQTTVIIIDPEDRILYQRGLLPEGNLSDHPGVAEALRGENGAAYLRVGNQEHVVAYGGISPVGWGLVLEESWGMVSTSTLRITQLAPLILVPALLFALGGLWFGARQIVQPLQRLEANAARLAWGDFQAIEEPVEGIAEIRRLQTELIHMARKLQAAQKSLHGYIGAITATQEDERRRLSRELHDDTLQALIALKQRIQFAQMDQKDFKVLASLKEIENLAEQTIENLRRLTRALRPIYLEDLGLSTALEMLAHETGQALKIPVEFQCQGIEKRLDPAIELTLYRMAQEACSNIARHAQAKQASLSIYFTSQAVTIEVVDDGIGFDVPKNPAEFAPSGHYGLLGLHERAELIGAAFEIRSVPGQGTHQNIHLPLYSS